MARLSAATRSKHNRVVGYAFILVTDRYPPFSMSQREAAPLTPEAPLQPQA